VRKLFALSFPGGARRKRRPLGLCLGLCLLLSASLPAIAQAPGRLVIPRAARVDIGHTGIHTHANFVFFDTGGRDLAAMQGDPARFPHLTLRAHSRLPTDHAALPPDMTMPGDPPLPNPFGPMEGGGGRPGWSVVAARLGERHEAKVIVPTRFANWVALQPPARRKAYLDPRRYWLEVRWGGL